MIAPWQMVPGGPSHSVGPFFSGANASRHHLPRSTADSTFTSIILIRLSICFGTATRATDTNEKAGRKVELTFRSVFSAVKDGAD